MEVKEVMKKEVISVRVGMSITEAAMILLKHNITGAPVIDQSGKLVGVVSEKDIFKYLYPDYHEYYSFLGFDKEKSDIQAKIKEGQDKQINEIMSKNVIYVAPHDSVVRVGALMIMKKIHRVVVVDKGKLVGIVGRRDVYHHVFRTAMDVEK
ncbi:MAG: CBS domain-containing protein [Parcubacteria group bacterium]